MNIPIAVFSRYHRDSRFGNNHLLEVHFPNFAFHVVRFNFDCDLHENSETVEKIRIHR